MFNIKTLVVFDIETTGLPWQEHNRTRITELALIACAVEHCNLGTIPRVLHKLSLCFNPMKTIHPTATDLTGLSNELLIKTCKMNQDVISMLSCFLSRLTPPVCLVSHNGNKFDFPILQREITALNMQLSDELLCADSLPIFQKLFPRPKVEKVPKELQCRADDVTCLKAIKNLKQQSFNKNIRHKNQTTPQKKKVPFRKELFPNITDNESSTTTDCDSSNISEDDELSTRADCDSSNISEDDESSASADCDSSNISEDDEPKNIKVMKINQSQLIQNNKLPSYKLGDIFQYLHGKTFSAHKAEDDALALLACITKTSDKFFDHMNITAVKFNFIQPLI